MKKPKQKPKPKKKPKKKPTSDVMVDGSAYDTKDVSMPISGKLFREAWVAPADGVIRLDINKVADMCIAKVEAHSIAADSTNFSYDGAVFEKSEHARRRLSEALLLSQYNKDGLWSGTVTDVAGYEHEANGPWLVGMLTAMTDHSRAVDVEKANLLLQIEAARSQGNVNDLEVLFKQLTT